MCVFSNNVLTEYVAYQPQCVLDFRSLYPSVVIAYNMCYSTLMGSTSGDPKIGVSAIERDRGMLRAAVEGGAFASPNGVMFMNAKVCIYICIYVYIYRERERSHVYECQGVIGVCVHIHTYIHTYIYIYIYI
jgi:hypothetical protein